LIRLLRAIQREVAQAIGDAIVPEARVPQNARRRRVTLLGLRDDRGNLLPGPGQAADGHRGLTHQAAPAVLLDDAIADLDRPGLIRRPVETDVADHLTGLAQNDLKHAPLTVAAIAGGLGLLREIPRCHAGPGQRVAASPGPRARIIRLRVGQDPCEPYRHLPQFDTLGHHTVRLGNAHRSPHHDLLMSGRTCYLFRVAPQRRPTVPRERPLARIAAGRARLP
jgi:hypothetical protein